MYFVKDKSKYFALKIWTNLKQKSFQCSRTDTFCLMHFCLKHMLKKQCFLIDNVFKNVNDWKLNCTDIFKNIKDAEKKIEKKD